MTPASVCRVTVGDFRLGRRGVLISEGLGEPKVQNLHRAFGRQHDVGGLQVTMDDAFAVRSFESRGDLFEEGNCLVDGDGPAGKSRRQRLAFDELHDEELLAVLCLQTIEGGDVGVIQAREELGFSFETGDAFLVSRKLLGQNFDRDGAVERVSLAL